MFRAHRGSRYRLRSFGESFSCSTPRRIDRSQSSGREAGLAVTVTVGLSVRDGEGLAVAVTETVVVADTVGVIDAVAVREGASVRVGGRVRVGVSVRVGVRVRDGVNVWLGLRVIVPVRVL